MKNVIVFPIWSANLSFPKASAASIAAFKESCTIVSSGDNPTWTFAFTAGFSISISSPSASTSTVSLTSTSTSASTSSSISTSTSSSASLYKPAWYCEPASSAWKLSSDNDNSA